MSSNLKGFPHRNDPAMPLWVKRLVGYLACAQFVVIWLLGLFGEYRLVIQTPSDAQLVVCNSQLCLITTCNRRRGRSWMLAGGYAPPQAARAQWEVLNQPPRARLGLLTGTRNQRPYFAMRQFLVLAMAMSCVVAIHGRGIIQAVRRLRTPA